jgi:hypothetical protein
VNENALLDSSVYYDPDDYQVVSYPRETLLQAYEKKGRHSLFCQPGPMRSKGKALGKSLPGDWSGHSALSPLQTRLDGVFM